MTVSPSAGTPLCVPQQGPHPGVTNAAPDSTNDSTIPSFRMFKKTLREAGAIISLTPMATFLPFSISAAI